MFKQAISKPKNLGPEHNPWFHNPGRVGIKFAPEWFLSQLSKLGEELSCVWNPVIERWQVFSKAPRINHPVCQGWKLLFIHQDADRSYMPLDERVFARLYAASVHEHGSAKQYFQRISDEFARDAEKKEARLKQEAIDLAMPFYEHSQIKNIGKGSKFSTYHS